MDSNAQTLAEIGRVAEGSESVRAKVERIAELIRRAGNYRWVGIYTVAGDEIAAMGWTGTDAPAHSRFPVSQGLCGAAVTARAAVVVGDVGKDPRYLTTFGTTRSEIVVPILRAATRAPVGLIDVESERVNAFSDADRAFLEECAAALAALWH